MNLRFLETFIWVARLKSFSLTAERLHTTQAAISARIASLEQELGVRLFDREGREVKLTPQGLAALDKAETIVRLADEFKDQVGDRETLRGTVRIGVIDTISHTWLVRLIERAHDSYPNVNVVLRADTSLNIADALLRHELDLCLLMGPVIGQNMVNIDLCTYSCVWLASPALPFPDRRLTVEDLARYPIVSFPASSKPHESMTRLLGKPEEGGVVFYTSNSLATIIRMVKDGLGVAALPGVLVQQDLAREELRTLDVLQSFPPLPFHASYQETPNSLLAGAIALMARDVADEFCASVDPTLAW